MLEQSFDRLGKFLLVDDARDFSYDEAGARNQNARGIADQPDELVADAVVADQDGIVHRRGRPVDVEALLQDIRLYYLLSLFVHGDSQDGESLGAVLVLE